MKMDLENNNMFTISSNYFVHEIYQGEHLKENYEINYEIIWKLYDKKPSCIMSLNNIAWKNNPLKKKTHIRLWLNISPWSLEQVAEKPRERRDEILQAAMAGIGNDLQLLDSVELVKKWLFN